MLLNFLTPFARSAVHLDGCPTLATCAVLDSQTFVAVASLGASQSLSQVQI
jgi:hypothetical protein